MNLPLPLHALIWVCVIVFMSAGAVGALSLFKRTHGLLDEGRAKTIFKIFVVEVVVAGVGTFGTFLYASMSPVIEANAALAKCRDSFAELETMIQIADGNRDQISAILTEHASVCSFLFKRSSERNAQ